MAFHFLRRIFIPIFLCGWATLARAERGCDTDFLTYCRQVLQVYEVKKQFSLFHWLTTQHYGANEKPGAYLQRKVDSFGEAQPYNLQTNMAGTSGLYLASDPVVTCAYAEPVTSARKPLLAMALIQPGTRVGFIRQVDRAKFPFEKDCGEFNRMWSLYSKKCLEEKNVTLFAYTYDENEVPVERRSIFGGDRVAFTAGGQIKYIPIEWNDLKNDLGLTSASIRHAIEHSPVKWCHLADQLPDISFDEESLKKIKAFQKENFFRFMNSSDMLGPAVSAPAPAATGISGGQH